MGAVTLAVIYVYGLLLTRGNFAPLGPDPFGLVYNSMLDHMLRGRWDVDPAVIGFEAFTNGGHTYAYFGPVPALLRLPLVLLPHWQGIHVERISCLAAILLGIAAQARAVLSALPPDARRLAPVLLLACAAGGPPLLLAAGGALIYHEAILWAWAFATLFVATALDGLRPVDGPDGRHLARMSLCAGLCLLTRSSTGIGLVAAVGSFLLADAARSRRIRWRRVWQPVAVLAAFGAAAALLNQGRWHHPLQFADLRQQTILLRYFPDRRARLQAYGLFNWRRIPLGFAYYFLPVWVPPLEAAVPIGARVAVLFDAAERPASSLLLTDPLWCALAGCGLALLVRRRASRRALPLLAGLSVAPLLMLAAWYLAFRYRVEFAPLLLALACLGLRGRWRHHRLAVPGLLLLCLLQVVGAGVAGACYARAPLGPSVGAAAFDVVGALRGPW